MSSPKTVLQILRENCDEFHVFEISVGFYPEVTIKTKRPLDHNTQEEIERSGAWYGGPTKINYEIIGVD